MNISNDTLHPASNSFGNIITLKLLEEGLQTIFEICNHLVKAIILLLGGSNNSNITLFGLNIDIIFNVGLRCIMDIFHSHRSRHSRSSVVPGINEGAKCAYPGIIDN